MTRQHVGRARALVRVARVVVSRPGLWPAAVVVAARLTPARWWRRWPPVPLPDANYWRFRMETAYGGDGEAAPDPSDVVEFLEWCRAQWRRPPRMLR